MATPIIRACAQCEADHGVLNRSDAIKTHGMCRRHFVEFLESASVPELQIEQALAQASPNAWCPDLSLEAVA